MSDEGVYMSGQRRARQRRRLSGIAAGVAVALVAGGFAVNTWMGNRADTVTGDPGALAPVVPVAPEEPTPAPGASDSPAPPSAPAPGRGPGTKAAVRQSSRPSPTPSLPPSPARMTDDELASAQISRLLQPRPARSGGLSAASERVTVRNETTPDGSNVRVVSARYDLTGQWRLLWAADMGRPVGTVRCTQNFRTDEQPVGEIRAGLLLCWRTSAAKSVVAVATGRPQAVYVAGVVEREWATLG